MNNFSPLIQALENHLHIQVLKTEFPPQGMDSDVMFVTDKNNKQYVIKQSKNTNRDKVAIELLEVKKIDIPIPRIIDALNFQGRLVLILEKISYPLLDSVPKYQMYKYIPSMIKNLKKIHQITSHHAGPIDNPASIITWKEFLLSIFKNREGLNWNEVMLRPAVEKELLKQSIDKVTKKIMSMHFIEDNYALLHTDFNQRNLFIDPTSNEITGIIDWAEAIFGDPLYDFARVRMYIWHFGIEDQVLDDYYKAVNFTPEQKELEKLYWVVRVIEYLPYYSANLTEFNLGRIKLHQEFLREYNWML